MSEIMKSEVMSRRRTLSLFGLAAAFGLAAPSMLLTVSNAEAQTAGMERRQGDVQDARSGVRQGAQDVPYDVRSGATERSVSDRGDAGNSSAR